MTSTSRGAEAQAGDALLPDPAVEETMLPKREAGGRERLFWLCAGVLVCSLLLGGGTHGGFLSDAVLELLAIPVFLISLAQLFKVLAGRRECRSQLRGPLMLCGAIVAVPLLQLIPLPPSIWRRLPGRAGESILLDLTGHGGAWLPISASPASTWLSALSLLPPLAIFLGAIQLNYRDRRALSAVILATGILSAFVGLLQIAQGPSSPLRPFEVTNEFDAVGFFANRNHFAALLYVVLLLAAVWAIEGVARQASMGANSARILVVTVSFLVLMLLIAAEAMARSRAGIVFMAASLAAAFGLAMGDRRPSHGLTSRRLIVGAAVVATMLAVQFGLYRVADRFVIDPLQDARISLAQNTIKAAQAFMPFGAGVGAFVPVYAMFENPRTTFVRTYANHAHDDILEVWLESGAAGILLGGLFVLWIVRKSTIWWQRPAGAQAVDHSLARAGLVTICLLVAHSFVDYPLRTGALEGLLAFACALLVPPPGCSGRGGKVRRAGTGSARSETDRSKAARPEAAEAVETPSPFRRSGSRTIPAAGTVADPLQRPPERTEEIDWRETWRQRTAQRSPGET